MSRPWTAVYEGIRTSGKLARLPDDTCRFFYTQLLLVVDAYGCIEADPVALDAKVWPALKKPASETARAVGELWRVGLVDIHGDARRYWLHLPDWDEKAGTHLKRKRGKPEFTMEGGTKKDGLCPSMTGVGPSMPVHDCPRPVYDGKKEKKDRSEERDETREEEEKKKKKNARAERATVVDPVADALVGFSTLDTPDVRAAAAEYVAWRKEAGHTVLKLRSWVSRLREFEPHGAAPLAAALRASVANGWQGVFPPRASGASAGPHKPGGMREWFAQQDAESKVRTVDVEGGAR